MSAPSIDCASSVEPLPLRHMHKRLGAWLNRRLPLIEYRKVRKKSVNGFNIRTEGIFFMGHFEIRDPNTVVPYEVISEIY